MPLPVDEMRAKHLVIAAAGGLCIYLLLNLFFGPTGLNRYAAREQYYGDILSNIEDLEERERELRSELEAYRTSSSKLRLQARKLGYFRPDERRIIVDKGPGMVEPPTPGRLIVRTFAYDDPRPAIRFAAVILAGGILALQVSLEGRRDGKDRSRGSRCASGGFGQKRGGSERLSRSGTSAAASSRRNPAGAG